MDRLLKESIYLLVQAEELWVWVYNGESRRVNKISNMSWFPDTNSLGWSLGKVSAMQPKLCTVNLSHKFLPKEASTIYWDTAMRKTKQHSDFIEFPDTGSELTWILTNRTSITVPPVRIEICRDKVFKGIWGWFCLTVGIYFPPRPRILNWSRHTFKWRISTLVIWSAECSLLW